MRNNRKRLATWIDVTDDAAPTTPDITLRTWVLLQWYSAPSMLLIEPVKAEEWEEISEKKIGYGYGHCDGWEIVGKMIGSHG